MTDVLLRTAAAADIEEAFHWYENRRPGLGEEFLQTLTAAFRSIQSNPERHSVVYRDTRRALLRRFPFAIHYQVRGSSLIIVACLHVSRKPRRWQGRL